MITIGQYLEKCKKKLNVKTFAAVARAADASPAYLLQVRSGVHRCNDYVCIRLAKIMNDRPERVLAIADYTTAAENVKPIREIMFNKIDQAIKKDSI